MFLLLSSGDRELFIRNQCLVHPSSCSIDRGQAFDLGMDGANTFLPFHILCYMVGAPPTVTECPTISVFGVLSVIIIFTY